MAKKTRGRTKPKVWSVPYWFDRARSLNELEGVASSLPSAGAGLIHRVETARSVPVGSLTDEQLLLLFNQRMGDPHFLVPLALPFLTPASALRGYEPQRLLARVLSLDELFWQAHPYLRDQLVRSISAEERRGLFDEEAFGETASCVKLFLKVHGGE